MYKKHYQSGKYKKDKWELIIINDNSKDSSKEILKQYKSIDNIHIITNKRNLGLPKSLNIGLKKARGQIYYQSRL